MADTEAEYQERLKALSASITAIQAELKNAKDSKSKLQQSLETSEKEVSTLSKKVSTIKEALAREKKHLNQLRAQSAELETQTQEQQAAIAEAIRQSYRLGQQSQLKLLLNQEDPERLGRMMNYHGYIIEAHQTDIKRYQAMLIDLNKLKDKVATSTQALEKKQNTLIAQQQQLKHSQQQRRNTLKKLQRSLNQKGQQLATLTGNQKRLQDLLDEATNALANLVLPSDAKPFAQVKGKLPLPTQGKLVYQYGSPQFEGKLKRNGIFISNRSGAKVVSVHHGRVIFSDYLRGHGLLLIIDHGNGYMSLYGHNQTLLKETGDWTTAGETIATIGNSGGQQQMGLYFEIRHKGRPQNPKFWLARR